MAPEGKHGAQWTVGAINVQVTTRKETKGGSICGANGTSRPEKGGPSDRGDCQHEPEDRPENIMVASYTETLSTEESN